MATITFEVPDELAERLAPYQDRLSEIIELGLRQIEAGTIQATETKRPHLKREVLEALYATGIVTLPERPVYPRLRDRHTPIEAGGKPACEIIIESRC
jgi:hypothetical protein